MFSSVQNFCGTKLLQNITTSPPRFPVIKEGGIFNLDNWQSWG